MSKIERYHFQMDSISYPFHREVAPPNLRIEDVTPSVFSVRSRVACMEKEGWINKSIYDPKVLAERIKDPAFRLIDIYDDNETDNPIGYIIITTPEKSLTESFVQASNNQSVIEIENLALFDVKPGQGRGWKLFTKIMDDLFEDHDIVYWSQSSTNFPTLKAYYERKGMKFLGSDIVENFISDDYAKLTA